MQNPPRFPIVKRVLFPFSGEEPLTLKQGLRVVLAWILLFSLPLSLCALLIALIGQFSLQRTITSILFAFLSGAFSFGILSALVVVMSNRSAHIRQAWKAQNGRS